MKKRIPFNFFLDPWFHFPLLISLCLRFMKFTMHIHTYVSFQNSLLDVFLPTNSIAYCAFFFFISSFAFHMTSYQTLIHYNYLQSIYYVPGIVLVLIHYTYLQSTFYVPGRMRAQEIPKYVKQQQFLSSLSLQLFIFLFSQY